MSDKQIQDLLPSFRLVTRKVIHLGEVKYTGQANPVALAINQVFKIEKFFGREEIGCTDVVARTIRPFLNENGYLIERKKTTTLPGEEKPSMVWSIKKPNQPLHATADSRA